MGKQVEPIRSNFLEWNRNAELYAFNERLSEKFDLALLEQALIHRSYIIKEEEAQRKQGISDPKLDVTDNRDLIQDGRKFVSKVLQKYLFESLPNLPDDGIMYVLIISNYFHKIFFYRRNNILSNDCISSGKILIKIFFII